MEGGRSRRPLAIGLAIAALAGGVALALALSGGDDVQSGATSKGATRTGPKSESTEQEASVDHTVTSTKETTTRTAGPPPSHDAEAMERAVVIFVEAVEQSDSNRACARLVGGAGRQLPGCAEAIGIDPRTLPTSDELDFEGVSASGTRGTARLSNGSTFSLEKSAESWLIAGFKT